VLIYADRLASGLTVETLRDGINPQAAALWRFDDPEAVYRNLLLLLALGTRQTIYRFYDDPLWSWLPFAAALALYPLLFGLTRHEARLAGLTLAVGPLVEVLYIQVGGLHRYPLGWIGGVPLWIALWWVLAVLLWRDLGSRIQSALIAAWKPRTTRRQTDQGRG